VNAFGENKYVDAYICMYTYKYVVKTCLYIMNLCAHFQFMCKSICNSTVNIVYIVQVHIYNVVQPADNYAHTNRREWIGW